MDTYRASGDMGDSQLFGNDLHQLVTLAVYGYDDQNHASATSPSKI